ncbi:MULTISPECIES: retron St85 family RNA-directed DNA polymerase [unclassified Arsukibacterium]|uniref:retron St85 family RNA-directed DNA polymerase n=1 Tax=unclassified Arsukibacterium TaxID=2635278 RepID=UPI0025C1B615|nr:MULTISPECIES: retron St85 family RNA-directed DNA polymerase [unclassified Arsukibacterium]
MILDVIHSKTFLEVDYIIILLGKVNSLYSRFSIDKKNGSGRRTVYHPSKELKAVQRVINDHIITKLDTHDACKAYKLGCTTKKNAEPHLNSRFLLRMDFKSFFESIEYKDVHKFCQEFIKKHFIEWTDEDSEIFSKFVCYKGRLVMGSVTSPALTNAMCVGLDNLLYEKCESIGVKYSRYADDLYFSTDAPNILKKLEKDVYKIVSSLKIPSSLKINSDKTYHSSRKRRMIVTGLVITNSGTISVGRGKKREIKSLVFNWESLDEEFKKYTSGYLSYIKSVEPEFLNNLCLKYGAEKIRVVMTYNQSLKI